MTNGARAAGSTGWRATGAQRRESREAPTARRPKRSEGNPEKRQRRDAGRGATGAQRRESREAPMARRPKRSEGNPEKRQRRDAGRGTRGNRLPNVEHRTVDLQHLELPDHSLDALLLI